LNDQAHATMAKWKTVALFTIAGPLFAVAPISGLMAMLALRDPSILGFAAAFLVVGAPIGVLPAAVAGVIFLGVLSVERLAHSVANPLSAAALGVGVGLLACLPFVVLFVVLASLGHGGRFALSTSMFLVPGAAAGGCCALLWRRLAVPAGARAAHQRFISYALAGALLLGTLVWFLSLSPRSGIAA
jgi:hypothetical protein